MKIAKIDKDAVVMCSEPYPDLTIEAVEEMVTNIEAESDIADLLCIVNNKAWWIEDDLYDFEVDTEEYNQVRERTTAWFSLMEKLENMIFDILKLEGVEIQDRGYISVLIPFMKRNGYVDGRGWWVKE